MKRPADLPDCSRAFVALLYFTLNGHPTLHWREILPNAFYELEAHMISMLNGTVDFINGRVLTIDVNGVGYEITCTANCLRAANTGQPLKVVAYTDVREDSIRLYGFEDYLEKQVFLLLLRVKGVGAKSASELISKIDKVDLLKIIAAGESDRLLSIKGVGKKTAERIILELRDKVGEYALEAQAQASEFTRSNLPDNTPVQEALEALQALGFGRKDAERALRQAEGKLAGSKPDASDLIRESLRYV